MVFLPFPAQYSYFSVTVTSSCVNRDEHIRLKNDVHLRKYRTSHDLCAQHPQQQTPLLQLSGLCGLFRQVHPS